jgi:sugar-specific transcriptional regulator TrmB
VAQWTERYRRIWEQRLDRLDRYLEELKEKTPTRTKEKGHARKQHRK